MGGDTITSARKIKKEEEIKMMGGWMKHERELGVTLFTAFNKIDWIKFLFLF